jgi:hypothetical protein
MSVEQGIFWLSSYPKSGNTWFRIVLANALNQTQEALSINQINITRHASDRGLLVEALGFNTYLLSAEELLRLRPIVYQWYSQQKRQVQYFKIHDAYINIDEVTSLVPDQCSLGALYFIRNPLDIAISFAYHSNISIDQSIDFMCDKEAKIFGNTGFLGVQLQQYLCSWSLHVQSWTAVNNPIPVLCLRYEDMHLSPLITFKKAMQFLKLDLSEAAIITAINHACFEKLQYQESQQSFIERSLTQKTFFRKGRMGDWEQTLHPSQIEKIIEHHQEVMFAYGYIDEQQNPIRYHTKGKSGCIL